MNFFTFCKFLLLIVRLFPSAPEKHSALVAISTCMGKGLDPLERDFLHRLPDKQHIELVVTSNGGWLPKGKDTDVNAISSASNLSDSESISLRGLTQLRRRLGQD